MRVFVEGTDLYIAESIRPHQKERYIRHNAHDDCRRRGERGAAANGLAATSLSLSYPSGVADVGQRLHIGPDRYYVYEVDGTTNNVTMLAGTGSAGYSGDGASTSAAVNQPYGVHVDASGNVYANLAVPWWDRRVGHHFTIAYMGNGGYRGWRRGDVGPVCQPRRRLCRWRRECLRSGL